MNLRNDRLGPDLLLWPIKPNRLGSRADIAADLGPLTCRDYAHARSPPAEAARRQRCRPGSRRSAKLVGERPIIPIKPAGFAGGALEPVEHLRGRVDLVVVLAVRKRRQLGEV